jgi:hypothetical protein
LFGDLSVVGGVAITGAGFGAGPTGAIEAAIPRPVGPVRLSVGLRFSVAHYARTDVSACGEPTGCLRSDLALAAGVPLTLRFGHEDARVEPFVGLVPEVIFDRADNSAKGGTRFGLEARAGALLRVTRATGFVGEVGYEASSAEDGLSGSTGLGAARAGIGYRVGF